MHKIAAELRHRIAQFLLAPDGVDYLLGVVAPGMPADALGVDEPRLVRALVAGFTAMPDLRAPPRWPTRDGVDPWTRGHCSRGS